MAHNGNFQYILTVQPHFLEGNFGSEMSVQQLVIFETAKRRLWVVFCPLEKSHISVWCRTGFGQNGPSGTYERAHRPTRSQVIESHHQHCSAESRR
jgi:hypothetical protein